MRTFLAIFTAVMPILFAANATAATTTCNTVAACIMGVDTSSGPGVGGGHSSVTFDYRVVAKPFASKVAHLPATMSFPRLARLAKENLIPRQ